MRMIMRIFLAPLVVVSLTLFGMTAATEAVCGPSKTMRARSGTPHGFAFPDGKPLQY
jgi:hypothetical protein